MSANENARYISPRMALGIAYHLHNSCGYEEAVSKSLAKSMGEVWIKYPIAKTSWSLLHDLYHDPLVLTADPSLTAISCIQLALETFGIQVPFVGSDSWYKVMDDKVTKDKLWEVMTRIMEVYNKEAEMIESIAK